MRQITIATLKNSGSNTMFFKNAQFFGDVSYYINQSRMELTVKMKADGLKRSATYKINDNGEIGDLIKH